MWGRVPGVASYAEVMPTNGRVSGPEMEPVVLENVKPGGTLDTDDPPIYANMHRLYEHQTIQHAGRIYTMGDVHTPTIEGWFATVKAGRNGVFHGGHTRVVAVLPERVRLPVRPPHRAGPVQGAGGARSATYRLGPGSEARIDPGGRVVWLAPSTSPQRQDLGLDRLV